MTSTSPPPIAPTADRPGPRRLRHGLDRAGKGLVGVVALTLLYEAARAVGILPTEGAPGVAAIVDATWDGLAGGPLLAAAVDTLQASALGLAVACAIGIPLGLAVGASRWADALTGVTVEFLRPVPAVALVPVAVVVFGLEVGMQVFLIGFACVWPVVLGTRHGVRALDPLMLDSARMLGLSRRAVVTRVVVPATAPAVATGVRTAASLGIVVAVAAEIVAGSPGLGQYLTDAQQGGSEASAFAAVLLSGLLGLAVNALFVLGESRLAGWQQHSTEERR